MLERALEFKKAFERMSVVDNHYIYGPSSKEWADVEVVCGYLQYFYEVMNIFSGVDKASSTSMMQTEVEDILNDFDIYLEQKSASKPQRSDLEMYLDEAVHPKQKGSISNFDILAWWRLNAAKYPILD